MKINTRKRLRLTNTKTGIKAKRFIVAAAILVGAVSAPTAANAACYIDRYAPAQFSKPILSAHTEAVMASLQGMDLAVSAAMNAQAKSIAGAVDILSQQKAASTKQFATAMKNNSHLEAQAIQEIARNKRLKKAIRDYSPASMGYKACEVSAKREVISQATKDTDAAIPVMTNREVTARPGSYGSRKDAAATRLALHEKLYCTSGQVASGLCNSEGSEAGKSLMAETLFKPSGKDTQDYANKSAFINNMVGLPDDPVPTAVAASSEAQAYSDLKRRKDAIKSTAITSLKAIQAMTSSMDGEEPVDKATNGTNTAAASTEKGQLNTESPKTNKVNKAPLSTQIKDDVSRYLGGGKEYEEWSKSLASAEEKGILTELVKNKALSLYIQAEKYKQYSRMEAMLAANVAAATINNGMERNVETSRQVALREHMQDTIFLKDKK